MTVMNDEYYNDDGPYLEDLVDTIVEVKQHVNAKTLKERAKESRRMKAESIQAYLQNKLFDNRKLCEGGSPWADCIEALEIHERKVQ